MKFVNKGFMELFKNTIFLKKVLISKIRYKRHKIYILCESRHECQKVGKIKKKCTSRGKEESKIWSVSRWKQVKN